MTRDDDDDSVQNVLTEGQLAELFLWRMEKTSKRLLRDLFGIDKRSYERKQDGSGVITRGTTALGSGVVIEWSSDAATVTCRISMVQAGGGDMQYQTVLSRVWFERQRPVDVKDAVQASFLRDAKQRLKDRGGSHGSN